MADHSGQATNYKPSISSNFGWAKPIASSPSVDFYDVGLYYFKGTFKTFETKMNRFNTKSQSQPQLAKS